MSWAINLSPFSLSTNQQSGSTVVRKTGSGERFYREALGASPETDKPGNLFGAASGSLWKHQIVPFAWKEELVSEFT